MSFRKASRYFNGLISHGSLWRWVQKEGERYREYFKGLEQAGPEYYEDAPRHAFLGMQADGINVRSQEKGKKRHGLKVATAYSGHRERGYGKERKLTDKALYISAESEETFVDRACLVFEKRLGVSLAKDKEIITDGAH